MANRRMIDPAFWESTKVAKLSFFERCLFIGIISNADDQGRMKVAVIRARVFPIDDLTMAEIQTALEAIEKQAGIILYSVGDDDFVQVRKWWDFQRPSWAWPSKYPPPPDWEDREKYRRGNQAVKHNWDTAHSDPIVTPPSPQAEPTPEPAPSTSGSGSTSDSGSGSKDTLVANATPTPVPQADGDYQMIRQAYIELFPDKPKPRASNKTLTGKVRTRMNGTGDHFKENWRTALERVSQSQFVKDGKWFDLGWFLHNDSNYEKCLNGNYDQNARASPRGSPPEPAGYAGIREALREEGLLDGDVT